MRDVVNKDRRAFLIRNVMDETGLSTGDVAKKVGVGRDTVRRWRDGVTAPASELLPALAEAIGLDVVDLVTPPEVPPELVDRLLAARTRLGLDQARRTVLARRDGGRPNRRKRLSPLRPPDPETAGE